MRHAIPHPTNLDKGDRRIFFVNAGSGFQEVVGGFSDDLHIANHGVLDHRIRRELLVAHALGITLDTIS
jgi:hypothetical protein